MNAVEAVKAEIVKNPELAKLGFSAAADELAKLTGKTPNTVKTVLTPVLVSLGLSDGPSRGKKAAESTEPKAPKAPKVAPTVKLTPVADPTDESSLAVEFTALLQRHGWNPRAVLSHLEKMSNYVSRQVANAA